MGGTTSAGYRHCHPCGSGDDNAQSSDDLPTIPPLLSYPSHDASQHCSIYVVSQLQ